MNLDRENWRSVTGALCKGFLIFWLYFASLIYLFALVVAPVISFFRFGSFALPQWVTPVKLILAPIICSSIYVVIITIATVLGFRPKGD